MDKYSTTAGHLLSVGVPRRSINPVEQEEAAPPARKGTASFQFYMKLEQDTGLPQRISGNFLLTQTMTTASPKKYKGIVINEPL